MDKRAYKKIAILIVLATIVLVLSQGYFSYQNYKLNKQRLVNDVQLALNASIDSYFANRAKNDVLFFSSLRSDSVIKGDSTAEGFTIKFSASGTEATSSHPKGEKMKFMKTWATDLGADTLIIDSVHKRTTGFKQLVVSKDSSRLEELQFLTQKVMVSITEDLLNLGALYEVMEDELKERKLFIDFKLTQDNNGRETSMGDLENSKVLTARATSGYLSEQNKIEVAFENATLLILKNGIIDLILSVFLISLIIGTMVYLYGIINAQKQLAAIKDDLISNITHEFKTPIATIFSALEGVTNFNESNDHEKTSRYLALSNDQLKKLNHMVEKMLETATIDQGKLTLNKEDIEVISWTKEIIQRFELVEKEKTISFKSNLNSVICSIDQFHMENALSNLIDNAIKYGGNAIHIQIEIEEGKCVWQVQDNGGNVPKAHRERIFEKLYRIPTGNQHDVKGFGIGLYYARTIAELHGGALTLEVAKNLTKFELTV